jgi:excisionase family DNA binding protein
MDDAPEARDPWLTPAEMAEMFGVTTRTIINWVRAGKITAQRTAGRHRRYRESDAKALLAELRSAA